MYKVLMIILLNCCIAGSIHAQVIQVSPQPCWLTNKWNAVWIAQSTGSMYDYGVKHFRKTFRLNEKPQNFIIHISADQRYELFVNGKRACYGPARSDLQHWYFETIDIASFLNADENLLAVTVWHYGQWSPGAQMSVFSGLIVQGNTGFEEIVNTNSSWKTLLDTSYSPSLKYLADVGPGDIIDGKNHPWGWNCLGYSDEHWSPARQITRGQPAYHGTGYEHPLVPREIPLMEDKQEFLFAVRKSAGVKVDNGFLSGAKPVIIPANTEATVLFDQNHLTNAYPEIVVSQGHGASITLMYAEGLYDRNGDKGNRNEVEGKKMTGFTDVFHAEGGDYRTYRPLWFRTYRYIQMDVRTKDCPLTIHSLSGSFTGYPFSESGTFECDDPALKKIWDVGWRTARLCAGETYYDCPYYEQLQYVGDTRIQALISLYVGGDDRLMRQAIKTLSRSRNYEGILRSRYPAGVDQFIPPFSLYWINMLHDYWMHRDDRSFVASMIPALKTILEWYAQKIDPETGLLGGMPHWNFVDWAEPWQWSDDHPLGGVPPGAITGGSAILSLQLSYTIADAIELLQIFGENAEADKYAKIREDINHAVWTKCYDNSKGLFADDLSRTSYSQHASIMAILSDAAPAKIHQELFEKLDADKSLIQATVYYRFYLFKAMKKAGLADRYVESLGVWKDMLDRGLTTFAERPEPSRSDCHAWSASPLYDFLATVCGIEPASCGFKSVRIAPHPAKLNRISGKLPHPNGMIEVNLKKEKDRLTGTIILPKGVTGEYEYHQKKISLTDGLNTLK